MLCTYLYFICLAFGSEGVRACIDAVWILCDVAGCQCPLQMSQAYEALDVIRLCPDECCLACSAVLSSFVAVFVQGMIRYLIQFCFLHFQRSAHRMNHKLLHVHRECGSAMFVYPYKDERDLSAGTILLIHLNISHTCPRADSTSSTQHKSSPITTALIQQTHTHTHTNTHNRQINSTTQTRY